MTLNTHSENDTQSNIISEAYGSDGKLLWRDHPDLIVSGYFGAPGTIPITGVNSSTPDAMTCIAASLAGSLVGAGYIRSSSLSPDGGGMDGLMREIRRAIKHALPSIDLYELREQKRSVVDGDG